MPYGTAATLPNSMVSPIRCKRAAEAVYSTEGRQQVKTLIDYYMKNAAVIRKEMSALGYECVGGENSPYIWIYGKIDSWDFF